MTNARCLFTFCVWVSAADKWWQPKQASKKKGKARVRKEQKTSGHPKKTMRQELLDQKYGRAWVSQIDQFLMNAV